MQVETSDQLLARALSAAALDAIAGLLGTSGTDVYLVGGTIRDLILGRAFVDVDLAIEGDPGELARQLGATDGAATRFGTISVRRDGCRYDLARTRSERYPQPGALPAVAPAGIDADLARRDFSVNAIALGLGGTRRGALLAAPRALADLAAGRLVVLHDRSFVDDPTRLLRLARYAARLRFEPAPHTRELARAAIRNHALDTISGTRLGNELRLLAAEPDPVAAFAAVAALGLPWRIDAPRARQALEVLPDDGRPDLLVLACVLAPAELDALGFTAADRETIARATQATQLAQRLARARTGSEIARAVGASGIEAVALASQGSPAQSLRWLRDLRHRRLDISGDDLIASGIPEGPSLGAALQAAQHALMDDLAPDRDSQLRVALKAAE